MEIEYPSVHGGSAFDKKILEILKNNDDRNKELADSITRGYLYSSWIEFDYTDTVWNDSGSPRTLLDFDFFLLDSRCIKVSLFTQIAYPNNAANRPIFELYIDGVMVQKWWTTLYNGYVASSWYRHDGYFSYIHPSLSAGSHNIEILAYNETTIFSPLNNCYKDITVEDYGAGVTAV